MGMNDKPDLKPCPFCGGDKLIICETDFGFEEQTVYAVSCRYPECHGGIYALSHGNFETKDEAIAAWNTRAVDPAAIREVSEADNIAIRNAALREVLALCKDFPYVEGVENAILELIGEKK